MFAYFIFYFFFNEGDSVDLSAFVDNDDAPIFAFQMHGRQSAFSGDALCRAECIIVPFGRPKKKTRSANTNLSRPHIATVGMKAQSVWTCMCINLRSLSCRLSSDLDWGTGMLLQTAHSNTVYFSFLLCVCFCHPVLRAISLYALHFSMQNAEIEIKW